MVLSVRLAGEESDNVSVNLKVEAIRASERDGDPFLGDGIPDEGDNSSNFSVAESSGGFPGNDDRGNRIISRNVGVSLAEVQEP